MKSNYKKLGEYIREINIRNSDLRLSTLLGVSVSKEFIPSIANTVGTDFSKYKIVRKNQFTYIPDTSRRGDKIGIALLQNYEEALVSQAYTVFEVVDKNRLNPEYLMMWFRRPEFDRYARFKSEGSVREIFSWNELCNVELPVPDIDKQRKIVEQYNQINKAIQIKEAINNNLEQQAQAIFKEKIILACNSERNKIIGEYCQVKSGYAFKSDWWQSDGVKVIKIGNLENNSINLTTCACVSEDKIYKAQNFRVITGDLLIAMTGATAGKLAIIPKTNEFLFVNQRVGKFLLGNDPISKLSFIYCNLMQKEVLQDIISGGDGSSAQANISPDNIMQTTIYYPDKNIIDYFNNICKPLFEVIAYNHYKIQALSRLRDTLLPNLMSGDSSDKLSFI